MSEVIDAGFPKKVTMPFTCLLKSGQVSEEYIQAVLDAGKLDPSISGDPTRLLAFLSGLIAMQANGIPVIDAISMARRQKRRLNILWSPRRWREEHDLMARYETMARLSAENVAYDLSAFLPHLPARFPGYIIRTSRRLGMEGLRQRHCVASYHSRIRDGKCAIASVFVDKVRWTVEILPTGNPDSPLTIGMIRSRFNQRPSQGIIRRIYEILGLETDAGNGLSNSTLEDNVYRYMQNLQRVLPVLRALDIESVEVCFDGSGDSGSIDGVYFQPEPDEQVMVEIVRRQRHFDHQQRRWIVTENSVNLALSEAIEEIAYDWLEETGVDWYNGEGGYGEMMIDVGDGQVTMEVNQRMIETSTEVYRTVDIETGEDIE